MKTITIDGVEYNLTPIKKTKKKQKPIILEQTLKFEVYPEELGDGWRLPTREELHLMWVNKDSIGSFAADYYWSSSESSDGNAWNQNFNSGSQYDTSKTNPNYVRAVRDVKR